MMTKGLFSLDEAADIGRAAIACKKHKQYNLARMYFLESAEKMNGLCQGKHEFLRSLIMNENNRESDIKRKARKGQNNH